MLKVEEGSLYPALYRMEDQGLIESEWGTTANNRKAKFYRLTRKGRAAAQAELEGWLRLSGAVTRVLTLAAGIYGLLSFVVSERTKEIGIRIALPACRSCRASGRPAAGVEDI